MIIPKFEAQKEWNAPTEFPDLRSYDEIAVDLETIDPDSFIKVKKVKKRTINDPIDFTCSLLI